MSVVRMCGFAGMPALWVLTIAAQFRNLTGVFAVFAAVLAEGTALRDVALASGVRALLFWHMRRLLTTGLSDFRHSTP